MVKMSHKIRIEIAPKKFLEPYIRIYCNGELFLEGKIKQQEQRGLMIKAKNGKEYVFYADLKEFDKTNIRRLGFALDGTVFDINDELKKIEIFTDNADRYYLMQLSNDRSLGSPINLSLVS